VVEMVTRERSDTGIAADFVHRSEGAVHVEGRVLDALGHDSARKLLPPCRELPRFVRRLLETEYRVQEVECGDRKVAARAPGSCHRLIEWLRRAGRRMRDAQVGAVDTELD